ncbi:uncharacterized protein LOC127862707 [Dreissena polymorpha]|uniref:uncharacterized protein LOC127862707 n=1 Tax=Dreissena polymorpha TaxID=45954 RepID=UPI0022641CB2|nr:uncharacterized protein LOC127862707 [Dreissena polymorpha]
MLKQLLKTLDAKSSIIELNGLFMDFKGLLKKLFPDEDRYIQVPELGQRDAHSLVSSWAEKRNRKLIQMDILLSTFRKCPTPLFLKLSFDALVRPAATDSTADDSPYLSRLPVQSSGETAWPDIGVSRLGIFYLRS